MKVMLIIKKVRNILLSAIYAAMFLIFFSEKWFLATWDSTVDFSTVVYQLFSPLKGTGSYIMKSYMKSCVYPVLLIMLFYYAAKFMTRGIMFVWEIRIGEKKMLFSSTGRYKNVLSCIELGIVMCIICNLIWKQAVKMGVIEYLEGITESSTIFEDEYVNPKDIAVSFPEKKRNLILIYLESMESTYASVEIGGGKKEDYIPELVALARDNLYFSDDEDFGGAGVANGTRWTMAALLASSAGVPYKLGIAGNTADMYERFLPGITSLGDILLENGYQNYFMCGSDIGFAGRKDFYLQHGDYTVIDINTAKGDGFIASSYDNGFWGMEDVKLFAYAKQKLSHISQNNAPFNFSMLTVDTHHPDGYICDYCGNEYEQQYANALACSSLQVGLFIEWVQEQPWYKDTTIVITGDHLSMKADFWDDIGNYERKIYNCFINIPDDLHPAKVRSRNFTTLDLFPSILAAMGAKIEGDRLGLGVNLFSEKETIPERIGMDEFNRELGFYSHYYFRHFIVGM